MTLNLKNTKNFSTKSEVSTAPSIEELTKIDSAAAQFKQIIEHHSKDYNIDYGPYSEPGAPDYNARIENWTKDIRDSEEMKSNKLKILNNLDDKKLKKQKHLIMK